MNRATRDVVIGTGAVAWLAIVTAGAVFAQNFTATVSPQAHTQASASGSDSGAYFVDEPVEKRPMSDEEALTEALTYTTAVQKFSPEELSHYTLGKTDVIEIAVLRHPEVSGQFVINNEGKIQYEFVGDVKIEGFTKNKVKEVLIEHLSEFIISPEITVKIVGYNSKIVYVIGEVGNPGKIFMRGDTITVREALVQAGLPLLSAKANKSRLITPSDDGKPKTKLVNIHKLLFEGDLRENLVMSPGDTLYLPPTFMAKAMRVIQPVAAPIGTVGGVGRTVMTGF